MQQAIETGKELREQRPEPIFTTGWFHNQFTAQIKRDYGYPENSEPVARVEDMEIVTGFFLRSHSK